MIRAMNTQPSSLLRALGLALLFGVTALLPACRFGPPPPYFKAEPPTQPQVPVFCYRTLAMPECHSTPQPGQEGQLTAIYQREAEDPSQLEYWTSPERDAQGNVTAPAPFTRTVTRAGKPMSVPTPAPVVVAPMAGDAGPAGAPRAGGIGSATRSAYTARSSSPYALQPSSGGAVAMNGPTYPTPPVTTTELPAAPTAMPPSSTTPRTLFTP